MSNKKSTLNLHVNWGLFLIIGQQQSGKSHLIKYIVSKNKDLSYGVVFSHTAFNEKNFSYVPKKYIYSSYSDDVLSNLMKIQESQPEKTRMRCFVIIDDCLDGWYNSKIFFNLATQLYHYNCTLIISSQYTNKIPPAVRENATFVAIFSFEGLTQKSLEALYESFAATYFNTINDFRRYLLKHVTKKYDFTLYDKNKPIEERFHINCCPLKISMHKLKY